MEGLKREFKQSILNGPSFPAVSDLKPTVYRSVVLNNSGSCNICLSRKCQSDSVLSLSFCCAFMCISLRCGLLSGKFDCLSLYTGSQRLVTVGVAVIFEKYSQVLGLKYIFIEHEESLTAFISLMFYVKFFPNILLSCTQYSTGN